MNTKPERLRVVHALAGAPLGGAESLYTRLVCALQAFDDQQQLAFTRDHPARTGPLRDHGVEVQTFRFGGPLDLPDRLRYRRALRSTQPDVVLTYMNRASGNTPAGDYTLACRLGHYYDLKYYRHADHWIGITRGICDHLVRGGMPAKQVTCIGNFADETEVSALPRTSFATPAGVPLMLAAGRLHRNKAFDTLLQALTEVPEAHLWLAGDGPEDDALRRLAAELGVAPRVRFLGWRDDVAALMRSVDLFVCPSRHEGLGSIVVESWFNECPIIATRSQGPGELISDTETGLLTPVDEPEALAAALRQALANPGAMAAMASRAKQHYQQCCSRQVIAQQYHDLFQRLGDERRG